MAFWELATICLGLALVVGGIVLLNQGSKDAEEQEATL